MEQEVTKEKFADLLSWSLQSAPITNKDFLAKIDEFHRELSLKKLSNQDAYEKALDKKMLKYIFDTYSKVVVTEDEQVFGITATGETVLLYNAEGTKVYIDATSIRLY